LAGIANYNAFFARLISTSVKILNVVSVGVARAWLLTLCVHGETLEQQAPGSRKIAPCLQQRCQVTHAVILFDHASK
jgi:hypothetical protein